MTTTNNDDIDEANEIVLKQWWVYRLQSHDNRRSYTGCSLDPQRRLRQHNGELRGGAKSTRAARPWHIVKLWGPVQSRSEAQKLEAAVRKEKILLEQPAIESYDVT